LKEKKKEIRAPLGKRCRPSGEEKGKKRVALLGGRKRTPLLLKRKKERNEETNSPFPEPKEEGEGKENRRSSTRQKKTPPRVPTGEKKGKDREANGIAAQQHRGKKEKRRTSPTTTEK